VTFSSCSLRWPDYHHALASTFRRLRDEEDFVDVTLACNSQHFTAHKVVLSACSPYFKQLLKVRIVIKIICKCNHNFHVHIFYILYSIFQQTTQN
jgi:hypothetical protein